MRLGEIERALITIRDRFGDLLESDASRILDQAVAGLRQSKEKYDEYQRRTDLVVTPVPDWGYSLRSTPLRFKLVTCNGYRLRTDIQCNMRWKQEEQMPTKQELVLRVWSADEEMMYRAALDSEVIGERVTRIEGGLRERVMLRYHFDLANSEQSGPKYHMQIGGNALPEEHYWYPKEFDLPRIIHQPFDLVLLCETVAANFFPIEYKAISRDPSWRWAIKVVQYSLLKKYYEECMKAIGDGNSLLQQLLNTRDDER